MGLTHIAFAQKLVNRRLLTPCTLGRSGVLLSPQPTMPGDGSSLRCAVVVTTTQARLDVAPEVDLPHQWLVILPSTVSVQRGDQIHALGNTYTVMVLAEPETYQVQTACFTYMTPASGTAGNYLRTNAVIGVSRLSGSSYAPVAGLSAVPAAVEDDKAGSAIRLLGTSQQMELQLLWYPGYDLQIGDQITGWTPPTTAAQPALFLERAAYREELPGLEYWIGKVIGLPSRCSIQSVTGTINASGGTTRSTSIAASNVPCSVQAGTSDTEMIGEVRMTSLSQWLITVPLGTPVGPKDQIKIGAATYEVKTVLSDSGVVAYAMPLLCVRVQ